MTTNTKKSTGTTIDATETRKDPPTVTPVRKRAARRNTATSKATEQSPTVRTSTKSSSQKGTDPKSTSADGHTDPKQPAELEAPDSQQPPPQKDDSNELVVFAMRLTRAERDAIHAAAGSGKASSFVRGLALAGARSDGEAFQAVIKEAAVGQAH